MKINHKIIMYIAFGIGIFLLISGIILMILKIDISEKTVNTVSSVLLGMAFILWLYSRHLRKKNEQDERKNKEDEPGGPE